MVLDVVFIVRLLGLVKSEPISGMWDISVGYIDVHVPDEQKAVLVRTLSINVENSGWTKFGIVLGAVVPPDGCNPEFNAAYAGSTSVFSRTSRLQFGHFAGCSKK